MKAFFAKWPDWAIRTIKTFVESFLGVFIPAFATLLSGGFPESLDAAWVVLGPAIAASLSAAITAAWNVLLEKLKEE